MSGRNAPEWFGGGFGGGLSASIDNDYSNHSNNGGGGKGKKKHRRSKSDTSYQKSSSRKAAERAERRQQRRLEKEKDKDNASGNGNANGNGSNKDGGGSKRRRNKATDDLDRLVTGTGTNTEMDSSSNTIFSTGTEAEAFSQFLQQDSSLNLSKNMSMDINSMNMNMLAELSGDVQQYHHFQSQSQSLSRENNNSTRTMRKKSSRHGRSFSMPATAASVAAAAASTSTSTVEKKKSAGFLERWLGFGRSDSGTSTQKQDNGSSSGNGSGNGNGPNPNTDLYPYQTIDQQAHIQEAAGAGARALPVHLHMNIHNKMEEKFDPDELRPLAPPSSSPSSLSSFHHHSLSNPNSLHTSTHTDVMSNVIHDIDGIGIGNGNSSHHSMNLTHSHHELEFEHGRGHLHVKQQQHHLHQQQQQLLPFTTYQKPAGTAAAVAAATVPSPMMDHGAESDDLFNYSDDDTASYIPQMPYPMQQKQSAASLLYPSYLSNEDMQNHEAYQVMQQQRMMALSQNIPNPNSNSNNNTNSNRNSNNNSPIPRYGATDLLPPLNQQQYHQDNIRRSHQQLHQQRFYRGGLNNPNTNSSNDMYISEDETMSSYHTQETFKNVDNYYFKRTKGSNSNMANSLLFESGDSSSEDQKIHLTVTQEELISDILTEENKSNSSVGEKNDALEIDPLLDQTYHQHNMSNSSLENQAKVQSQVQQQEQQHASRDIFMTSGANAHGHLDGSGSSGSGSGSGNGRTHHQKQQHQHEHFDATTSAMMEQLNHRGSRGLSNLGGEDNHSSSSGSSQLISPPGRSHSSGSGSATRKSKSIIVSSTSKSPLHQRQAIHSIASSSPPPPIASVQIIRNSGTTTTTGSNSSSSPHTNPRKLLHSSSSSLQQTMHQRRSRKEMKRLRKRIELAEGREDYVQFLLRDGHRDLDWSEHVPQNVMGMNRAAGFFPEESTKPRDFMFAFLFIGQLSTIIFLASRYARGTILRSDAARPVETNPYMVDNDDPFSSGSPLPNDNSSPISIWAKDIYVDYANAVQLSCITGLYATVLSALAIGMMMILSSAFIPTVLCGTVVICVVFGTIMMALSPYTVLPVLGLAALAISLAYSVVVWDRIPFATTNLNTALAGMKSSADILLIGFAMMVVAFLWTITWMIAFLGIYDHYLDNAEHELSKNITSVGLSVSLGMFISYAWTFHVIMNIVHVTVAGVVGTWWASPDSLTSCCTNVFREHFIISITKSFGSICFGSLVVPPLGVLQFFLLFLCPPQTSSKSHSISIPVSDHSSHAHDVGSMMGDKSVKSELSTASFYPQMSSPLDGIMRYFNDFGFTYVGLYRQGFIVSSEKATDIFQARGWSGIVADRLIPYILKIICLFITLGSGLFGLVVEEYDGYSFTNFRKPTSTAFIIGCFVGMVLSSVCLKVVESSVSTVLVCFSVAPYAFKHFHPVLSNEMRGSWGGVWLDEITKTPVQVV